MEISNAYTNSISSYNPSTSQTESISKNNKLSNGSTDSSFLNQADKEQYVIGGIPVLFNKERIDLELSIHKSKERGYAFKKINDEMKAKYKLVNGSEIGLVNNVAEKTISYFGAVNNHTKESFDTLEHNINLIINTVREKNQMNENTNKNAILLIENIVKELVEFFQDRNQFNIAVDKAMEAWKYYDAQDQAREAELTDCVGCFGMAPTINRMFGGAEHISRIDTKRKYIPLRSTKEILDSSLEDSDKLVDSFAKLIDFIETLQTMRNNLMDGKVDKSNISTKYPSHYLGSADMNSIDKIVAYTINLMTETRGVVNTITKKYSPETIMKSANIVPSPTMMLLSNINTYKDINYNSSNKKWKLLQTIISKLIEEDIYLFTSTASAKYYNNILGDYKKKKIIKLES